MTPKENHRRKVRDQEYERLVQQSKWMTLLYWFFLCCFAAFSIALMLGV